MKKTEIGALVLIFASIFFFRLYWVTFKEKIEVGDIVKIDGRVDAGGGKIQILNGKYPVKNTYFLVDDIEDVDKTIFGEIKRIKTLKWGEQYYIESIEVKAKQNFMKEFLSYKIEKMSENYSIGLENILKAILLGEGYLLANTLKEKFRYTGTSHFLVISGLHIGIIISGTVFLLLKLKIPKKIRYSMTFLILTLYVIAIGKSPSVFRAYLMGSVYLLGNIMYEKVNTKKSFIFAFIISLLIYPTWIYSISFWMSYLAIFSILFVYGKVPKIKKFKKSYINSFLDAIAMTIVIQLCMTPIFYTFFKTVPLLSFISNIIVIPIGSIFVMLSFFTMFLSNFYLDFLVMPLVNINYLLLIKIIEILNEIPYLTLYL